LAWANRIGALTLVIGVAFFFRYAIDNNWIGPGGRVVLGVLAGLFGLVLGELSWRRTHRVYAQGITAAGVSILYLSCYAGYGFYHLIPQPLAFLFLAVTALAAGVLALRYSTLALAVMGLVGGFLAPVLLATNEDHSWGFLGYLLILNAGVLLLARVRRWQLLEILAPLGTLPLVTLWADAWLNAAHRPVATFFALAFYALYLLPSSALILGASHALVSVGLAFTWWDDGACTLWYILPVAAAGLGVSLWRKWQLHALLSFTIYWSLTIAWQMGIHNNVALGSVLGAATSGFLLFLAWLIFGDVWRDAESRVSSMAILAMNGPAFFGMGYLWLDPRYHEVVGLFAVLVAGVHVALGSFFWKRRGTEPADPLPRLIAASVSFGLLTLAIPIQFSGTAITIAWAIGAALLAWLGKRTSQSGFVAASGVLHALACVRLLALDAVMYSRSSAHPLVWNSRMLSFALTCASLWAAAFWLRPRFQALVTYLAGHAALLMVLTLEVVDWAGLNAPPQAVASVTSVAISALLAVYGMVLVVAGMTGRFRLNRLLGLGLLAVVICKLYMLDVWDLQLLHRVLAFIVLGALLLATSYLYSRYRSKFERLWRDDANQAD
jgi:hypothetical protein